MKTVIRPSGASSGSLSRSTKVALILGCLLCSACFFTDAPVFTPDQVIAPDPGRYHDMLLVPASWTDPVPEDPEQIAFGDRVGHLTVIGGVLTMATCDVWSEQDDPDGKVWKTTRIGERDYLIMADSLEGDNDQFSVEPFYRILPGQDGAPDAARLFDQDYLQEHLANPYDVVLVNPQALKQQDADTQALLTAFSRQGLSLDNGRETRVHGPTAKLQAFMLDQEERLFRIPFTLQPRTPELLATLRQQATARRLAWLRFMLGRDTVERPIYDCILTLEGHAAAIPALAEGLQEIRAHAIFPRCVEAEETMQLMNARGLGRHLGKAVVTVLLPAWTVKTARIYHWSVLNGMRLQLVILITLDSSDTIPTEEWIRFDLILDGDGRLQDLSLGGLSDNVRNALSEAGHEKLGENRKTLQVLLERLKGAALDL